MKSIRRIEPTEVDWAKLAAYIDGEGCISIKIVGKSGSNGLKYHLLEVAVTNSDPRLPLWCAERFGGTVQLRTRPDRPTHRQGFHWRISSRKAEALLHRCMEYFVIKKEQAEVACAFQATMLRGRNRSNPLPEEVIEARNSMKQKLSELKRETVIVEFARKTA